MGGHGHCGELDRCHRHPGDGRAEQFGGEPYGDRGGVPTDQYGLAGPVQPAQRGRLGDDLLEEAVAAVEGVPRLPVAAEQRGGVGESALELGLAVDRFEAETGGERGVAVGGVGEQYGPVTGPGQRGTEAHEREDVAVTAVRDQQEESHGALRLLREEHTDLVVAQ